MVTLFRLAAWRRGVVSLLAASALTACGGGGGGGGPDPIVYTGATTAAVVNELNAAALAGESFLTGGSGASTGVLGAETSAESVAHGARPLLVARALKKSVSRLELHPGPDVIAGSQGSGNEPGSCGGSLSYQITVNDSTGDFSGTLDFNNLCVDDYTFSPEDDVILSGRTDFSGNVDPSYFPATVFTWMSIQTSSLNTSTIDDSYGIGGSILFTDITDSSERITQSLRFRLSPDFVTQNVNYIMQVFYDSPSSGTDRIRILSGKYYRPLDGYVDVTGTQDFLVLANSLYPHAGKLKIVGAVNSQAELTANGDAETFDVAVDLEGDTIVDATIDDFRWDAL